MNKGTIDDCFPDYLTNKHQSQDFQDIRKKVGEVIQGIAKYSQVQEQSKSSRKGICLKTAASLENIRSERRLMINRLEHRFGNRQDLYQYYIKLIDAVLAMPNELQNEQIIRAISENILNVYQDNLKQSIKEFRQRFGALHNEVYI